MYDLSPHVVISSQHIISVDIDRKTANSIAYKSALADELHFFAVNCLPISTNNSQKQALPVYSSYSTGNIHISHSLLNKQIDKTIV